MTAEEEALARRIRDGLGIQVGCGEQARVVTIGNQQVLIVLRAL